MWDLFCKVVDNYGDAGVCWRLSRQLAAEHDLSLRLWIDDIPALARMWPGIDPRMDRQNVAGVTIRRWDSDESVAGAIPSEAVIEAFGCDIPQDFIDEMTRRPLQPAWFNLEYLTAEDWVESHHLLPSPHPRLKLVKYFYFPGFTAKTGGLLREAKLFARRDAFRRDAQARAAWWKRLGMTPAADGELRVSMFAYANPAAPRLFDAWAGADRPITCVVPEGVLRDEVATFAGADLGTGDAVQQGNLRLVRVPFVTQDEYDTMLWASDFNFVRGEDSFVRAQWAARPMAWHIYPQEDDAHRPKLAAFVDRYTSILDPAASRAVRALFEAWNGAGDMAVAWSEVQPHMEDWTAAAGAWAAELASRPDLATGLVDAAANRL